MPSLGPAEILVILVIALLVFGPNKLPDVAKQAGKAFQELRRVQQHLRSEISGVLSDFDGSSPATPDPSIPTQSSPTQSGGMPGGDPVPMLPPLDTHTPSDPTTAPAPQTPPPSDPPPADPA